MQIGYFDTKELASKDGQRSPFGEQQVRSELLFLLILRAYVWVVRPPILGNESLLTNTERAPGTRYAAYLRDYRGLSP